MIIISLFLRLVIKTSQTHLRSHVYLLFYNKIDSNPLTYKISVINFKTTMKEKIYTQRYIYNFIALRWQKSIAMIRLAVSGSFIFMKFEIMIINDK